jgi:hypothetical protein
MKNALTNLHRTPSKTASLLGLSVAALIAGMGSCYAQPEMDRCGRDITSGPLDGLCLNLSPGSTARSATHWRIVPDTTQSIDRPNVCMDKAGATCPNSEKPAKQG